MIPHVSYPVLPQLLLHAQQMPCGGGRDQDEGSFLQQAEADVASTHQGSREYWPLKCFFSLLRVRAHGLGIGLLEEAELACHLAQSPRSLFSLHHGQA